MNSIVWERQKKRLRTAVYWYFFLALSVFHFLQIKFYFGMHTQTLTAKVLFYAVLLPVTSLVLVFTGPVGFDIGDSVFGPERRKSKIAAGVAWILFIMAFLSVLQWLASSRVSPIIAPNTWGKYWKSVFMLFMIQISNVGLLLFGSFWLLHRKEVAEEGEARVRILADRARVRVLQRQIHPHVLRNVFWGLAELIHKDARQGEAMTMAIAGMFDRLLRAADEDRVLLMDEKNLLDDYLAVEGMRLGDRLRVIWEVDPALWRVPALPLLLQPLAENAIKHGIAPHPAGGDLRIKIHQDGQELCFRVENTGCTLEEVAEAAGLPGIGNQNLRERLRLAYGPQAFMDLRQEGEWVVAEVRIPLEVSLLEESAEHPEVEAAGNLGQPAET